MSAHSVNPLIVIFSPVRLSPEILRETLQALVQLTRETIRVEYWFYDDNDTPASSQLLHEFVDSQPATARLLPPVELQQSEYKRTAVTHEWNGALVDRISAIKNAAISAFLKTPAHALFLLDADLILHPQTLEHLYALDVPIVSEVFWTQFTADAVFLPNVWDVHSYTHHAPESITKLREPGLYRVGGLGACTLVRRAPLGKGVSFARIENLDFWGEDRHFCVRAVCLGFPLYADTTYPPFHVYRESLLPAAQEWKRQGCAPAYFHAQLDSRWEAAIRRRFTLAPPPFVRRVGKAVKYVLGANQALRG